MVKIRVDQADPRGSARNGSPSDEYDDAVTELTRHVLRDEPVDHKARSEQWFGRVYGAAPAGADGLVAKLEMLSSKQINRRSYKYLRGKPMRAEPATSEVKVAKLLLPRAQAPEQDAGRIWLVGHVMLG